MDSNIAIIKSLQGFLLEAVQSRMFFSYASAFSRKAIFDLKHTVFFILSLSKKSLSLSLDDFIEDLFCEKVSVVGKSCFSKARYKLKSSFFYHWNQYLVELFRKYTNLKHWQGFALYGIDGSTLCLPNTKKIRASFGEHKNQNSSFPMARILACYDLLNGLCIRSTIVPIKVSELAITYKWIARLPEQGLYIFDRGFASFVLFWLLNRYAKNYLVRCKLNFNNVVKDFVESGEQSRIVEMKANDTSVKTLKSIRIKIKKNTTVKLRLVRVVLDDGDVEVLATSLLDTANFPNAVFKDLYFKRWAVETFFNRLKNQVQLEIFTGRKAEAIKQEFYASIFLLNLQALLIEDCQQTLQKHNKKRKYTHKINCNISYGLLRKKIVKMMLSKNPTDILKRLKQKFLKNTIPIKPNRKNPRNKNTKKRRNKFHTETNFARAA